ncbi:MAG: hypothetical protein AAGF19_00840 [Pseudomonadota bacterium]
MAIWRDTDCGSAHWKRPGGGLAVPSPRPAPETPASGATILQFPGARTGDKASGQGIPRWIASTLMIAGSGLLIWVLLAPLTSGLGG